MKFDPFTSLKFNLVSVFLLCGGCLCLCDGLQRGSYYPLLKQEPQKLAVERVSNLNGRRILPNYVATGSVSNVESPVTVEIFEDQFKNLRRGDLIDVYHLDRPGERVWINGKKLEESKPISDVFGFCFSWHLVLAGLLMIGVALIDARRRMVRIQRQLNRLLNKHSLPVDSGAAPPSYPAK